ncbi:hypothetical protein [Flagellimonas marinaquae]|uniref:hypothetical protein n=1 Tax=Flagellimonas marinaquae TaxID=254955 RepID=UPI000F8CEB7E|nr:hypothetical protein [Allomuricauda aquimarina]
MKRLILGNIICVAFLGCTPEQSTVSEYQIESGLDVPIVLRFFRNGLPSVNMATVHLKGIGDKIKRFGETLGTSTSPFDVFDADSILIVFDEKRFQGHNLFEPKGSSLLNQLDYQNLGNGKFLYVIDEENFSASLDCQDICY